MTPEEIRRGIEEGIAGARARVRDLRGTGDHFEALVVAQAFKGLSLVERHRLVYAALGDNVGGAIHALALKTLTPAEAGVPAEEDDDE